MRLLIEEYNNILITFIGGIIIISIIVNSLFSISISTSHLEERNNFNMQVEKIGVFECKDVYIDRDDYDLLKDVKAYSNSNVDLKDKVIARIKEDSNGKYVEYVLKYCNDYRILRAKLYGREDNDENDV